jgi:hypothetical protein
VSILDALDDPQLFASLFPSSWAPWRAFLAAIYGLPLDAEGLARNLERLGLDRKVRDVPDLRSYLARRSTESATRREGAGGAAAVPVGDA